MRNGPRKMMKRAFRLGPFPLIAVAGVAAVAALNSASCKSAPDVNATSYFDRSISPVLQHSCSRQTTGCHVANAHGDAVGNLDTTTFETFDRRHDLLVTYGPYNAPGLLTKVSGPQSLTVSTLAGPISITTDIRHAAGAGIDVTSESYAALRRWMDSGATKENVGQTSSHITPTGDCKKVIPVDPGFDPKLDPPALDEFRTRVQPVLRKSCSAASCHGNDVADLSLTCGDDDAQVRWNAYIAGQFLAGSAESSELLRRPLDPSRGGVFHEGGVVFTDPADEGYRAMLAWAKARGPAAVDTSDPAFVFFANRVQPEMVRKGCMFLGCHSPQMFHDLRLRGGSGGQFSTVATRRNYVMSKLMLSIESPDPNVSRLINKNLYPYDTDLGDDGRASAGARHRGGALLEDVPDTDPTNPRVHQATAIDCAKVDVDGGDLSAIPAYCVFAAWQAKERASAIAKGPAAGGVDKEPLRAIVYVERAPNTDAPQQFDTYRPGSTLHLSKATLAADGTVSLGADKDLTAGCGLSEASADIRGPAVSWDGAQIAFAARTAEDAPLAIYTISSDGSGCARLASISGHDARVAGNPMLVHDFDPTYAPDGRIVFASTRGMLGAQSEYGGKGPTRAPGTLLPSSNLYVLDADATVRQLTFLLGDELAPSFMHDGRLVFTTEKREPGFYQLSGRRMNLDGGDYHPLFAQRKSLGYEQMTEIHELADRGFVAVMSDHDALAGAGTLGVVNRSLGPDQGDRDPADRFYLHSLTFPDPGASGKKGTAGGAYRSPAPLPTHAFLASYAAGGDVGALSGEFELVVVDDRSGARTSLVKKAGKAIVDAEAVYARANLGVFTSRLDEVNGATHVEAPPNVDADVTVLDMGLLSSLLFKNTRIGREINDNVRAVGILEELPPPSDLTTFGAANAAFVATDDVLGAGGKMWVQRRRLGVAPLMDDASLRLRIPGGVPIVLELYDAAGKVIATQREEMEFSPGERSRIGFRREFFDAQCGGCHGSVSGKEIDVHLRPDVLTSASRVSALNSGGPAINDFFYDPSKRGAPFGPDPSLGK